MVTEADIRAAIAQAVVNFDSEGIKADDNFYEAGLDSLDHASVLLALQESHGLVIPDEALDECSTIAGILTYAETKA